MKMTQQDNSEQVIQDLTNLLRSEPFSFEIKVVKKPRGIRIIYEVTQEDMNKIIERKRK